MSARLGLDYATVKRRRCRYFTASNFSLSRQFAAPSANVTPRAVRRVPPVSAALLQSRKMLMEAAGARRTPAFAAPTANVKPRAAGLRRAAAVSEDADTAGLHRAVAVSEGAARRRPPPRTSSLGRCLDGGWRHDGGCHTV